MRPLPLPLPPHRTPLLASIILLYPYPSDRFIRFPHQMYDEHPALEDLPTVRPLLTGRQRSHTYRRSVAAVETLCDYTDTLREDMAEMLAWMDEGERLDAGENWRLASNIQFLMNKEMGGTPRHERCNAVFVKEGGWFRIEVTVGRTVVVAGEWVGRVEEAILGLRRKVDEAVYGRKEEYMGVGGGGV